LAFTRASNGTRINSQGLVEVVPWNLFQQSENFPNAIWTKSTLTFNSTVTAPNGTSTAQNYSTAGAYSYALQTITVSSGEYYTVSCYLKYTSGVGSISIGYTDAPSNNFIRVDANLINGTIGSVSYGGNGANGTATITSVGDGWYRVTVSGTLTIGNAGLIVSNLALGATTFSIWGAQLNIGATAKPYFPTTDRLNVPRLTYQNGGGGCPSLLLEKQSTNVILYSEQFDDASWTKNVSVTANAIISPDGTQNADKILESASNVQQWAYQSPSMTGAQTATIYAKKGERNYIAMATAGLDPSYFNLDTGVVVSTASGATASITSVGNGWYRCSVSSASIVGGTFYIVWISYDGVNRSYAGDPSKGVYVWGAQNEASSYPTSYIPTTSSSATRVLDECSKTGISSLIGQTSGTIFWDINFVADGTEQTINISDGTNFIYLQKYTDNKFYTGVYNGSFVGSITSSVLTSGRKKIAFGYILNSLVLYINGVLIGTDLTSTIPTCDRLSLTVSNTGSIETNNFILFPTKLTNAELQALTTL
jgi:hypothetical protein